MELRWKRWVRSVKMFRAFFKNIYQIFFLWNWWNWFARYQWLEKLTRRGIAFRVLNPLKTSCNVASWYDALFLSNFNHFQMEIIQWHFISLIVQHVFRSNKIPLVSLINISSFSSNFKWWCHYTRQIKWQFIAIIASTS